MTGQEPASTVNAEPFSRPCGDRGIGSMAGKWSSFQRRRRSANGLATWPNHMRGAIQGVFVLRSSQHSPGGTEWMPGRHLTRLRRSTYPQGRMAERTSRNMATAGQ